MEDGEIWDRSQIENGIMGFPIFGVASKSEMEEGFDFASRFPPRHLEASRLGGWRNLGLESDRGWNN